MRLGTVSSISQTGTNPPVIAITDDADTAVEFPVDYWAPRAMYPPVGVRVLYERIGRQIVVMATVNTRYYRHVTFSKALTTGNPDTVSAIASTVKIISDYGGCFSSGEFVVPALGDDYYTFTFEADNLLTAANNARIAIQVDGSAEARTIYTGGGGGSGVLSVDLADYWLVAGQHVSFPLITAGPNVTVTGTITVCKG